MNYTNTNTSLGSVIVGITFIVIMIVLWPIMIIWAWNVLFGAALTIPMTIETWFASWIVILVLCVRASASNNK